MAYWHRQMGKTWRIKITAEQLVELEALKVSEKRREAQRAEAILLSHQRFSSAAIAEKLNVSAGQVRRWRGWFVKGGVPALRLRPHTGRPPTKATLALALVAPLLETPPQETPPRQQIWSCGRLAHYIEQESGVRISAAYLSKVLRKKGGIGANVPGTPSKADKIHRP